MQLEVMVTQNSKPSGSVGSPNTPTGEESVTPISQPSGLGALSASMSTEPDRKTEAIQRAQVGSLMGANGNNEPQNNHQRSNHLPQLLDPKSMLWKLG